jgi:dipeptidyl aminopeptidase/acylaminoacyl peptidase
MNCARRSVLQALAAGSLAPGARALWAQAAELQPAQPALEDFFSKPAYGSLVLSPGQRHLAALVPAGGRRNLAVVDLDTRAAALVTAFTGSDVNTVFWARDDRLLFTTGDQQGLEFRGDGGLFAVDRDGSNARVLVEPLAARGAYVARLTQVLARVAGSSAEVLVSANDRSADTQDVYRMNVTSGRKSLVLQTSPGHVKRWVLDGRQQPRAAFCMEPGRRRYAFAAQREGSRQWTTYAEWDEQLRDVILPLAFAGAAPDTLYVASNAGRDTLALFTFDLASGRLGPLVYGDDRYDIASFELLGMALGEGGRLIMGTQAGGGKLLGLRYNAEKPRVVWFDEAAARVQASVDAALPGLVNVFEPQRGRALVFSSSDVEPGRYHLFDFDSSTLEDTGVRVRPRIDARQMRPMQPVSWMAHDGLRVDGYLTLPARWSPGRPVPLVVRPHGGPWAKDNWGFNAEVQFLASRGYAVLQPNFRGSTGFGAQHLRLSYRQWGGTMIDDMLAGVDWAVREGYADPAVVGAWGASYGGYATLMLLVRRPDLFRWGVNYVGVTDMEVHQDTQPAQLHGEFAALARALNGDKRADAELFAAQSPARHVQRIRAPVFHAYGGSDRNVDFANGQAIKAAFEKAGKPFEWMFVADEGHGYRQDAHVLEFYGRVEAFIRRHAR